MSLPLDVLPSKAHSKEPQGKDYLHHLDGLRALALVGVLIFHFDPKRLPGGYVGVDCFLVLSGYLMTRNILRRIEHNTFSLRSFFVSRFWRLLPSSLVVNLATTGTAFLLFPRDHAQKTAESALSSLLLSSNIYFWLTAKYFDSSAVFKPLLHTWSLSLEEQYYMVYPICIMAAQFAKSPRRALSGTLGAVLLVSYSVCVWYQRAFPNFVFYMLPARAYEFALGGLAYFLEAYVPVKSLSLELASTAGFAAILWSYIWLPGAAGAAFCMPSAFGTALIIVTPSSWFNRNFLSGKVAMFVGRISYAAYLVHWPLFVYVRYVALAVRYPIALNLGVLLTLTLILALALHLIVETPMRSNQTRHLKYIIPIIICAFALARSGVSSKGWKFRQNIPPEPFSSKDERFCVDVDARPRRPNIATKCIVGLRKGENPSSRNSHAALVVGSSFAGHLLATFNALAKETNATYLFHIGSGCPISSETNNILSLPRRNAAREQEEWCKAMNKERWKLIKEFPDNSTVVLSDEWIGSQGAAKGINAAKDVQRNGKKAVIAGAIPGILGDDQPLTTLALAWQWLPLGRIARGLGIDLNFPSRIHPHGGQVASNNVFVNHTRRSPASFRYANILDDFCTRDADLYWCVFYTTDDGIRRSLYHDGWHLSYYGSRRVAPLFRRALATNS